jgi:hypothetical protein
MYLITCFGVTIGFHRMLTHRAFRTSKPVEYLFAAAGSMAVQGPVINWVADHRKHHAYTDGRAIRTRPMSARVPASGARRAACSTPTSAGC